MVKKLRSFARRRMKRTVLVFVSGLTIRIAEIRRGLGIARLPDRQSDLLLGGRFSGLKRSGVLADIIVGVGSDNAIAFPVELVWHRERPEERVSIAEVRSLHRELVIRSREQLRHMPSAQHVTLATCQQVSLTLDGRRVFNPTGFVGEEIRTAANAIALTAQSTNVIGKLKEAYPRASIRPVLIDLASARFARTKVSSDVIVVVGPQATSVLSFDDGLISSRNVFSIGEDSITQHLLRATKSVSERDILRYMHAGKETTRGDRELTAIATPVARRWARALENAVIPLVVPDMRIVLVSGTTLPTPLAHLLKPQVERYAFPTLHQMTMESITVAELLSSSPFNTVLDAIFSLIFNHERLDPFVK